MTHDEALPAHRRRSGKISPIGKAMLIAIGTSAFCVFTTCFCLDLLLCVTSNNSLGCTVRWLLYVPTPAPSRAFITSSLLLDEDSLPPGWKGHGIATWDQETAPDEELCGAHQRYTKYDDDGGEITTAYNSVQRFGTIGTPFESLSEYIFANYRWESSLAEFESRYADRWRLACGMNIHLKFYQCIYYAEYVEYLVRVDIEMAHNYTPDMLLITYDEAISIFKAMDDRMAQFLGLEQ